MTEAWDWGGVLEVTSSQTWGCPQLGRGAESSGPAAPPKCSAAPASGGQDSAFADEAGRDSEASVKVGMCPVPHFPSPILRMQVCVWTQDICTDVQEGQGEPGRCGRRSPEKPSGGAGGWRVRKAGKGTLEAAQEPKDPAPQGCVSLPSVHGGVICPQAQPVATAEGGHLLA